MSLKARFGIGLLMSVALSAPVIFTAQARHDDGVSYRAHLLDFGEVPPKITGGSGNFSAKLSADGNSINWRISWTGLTGPAMMSHIHFGQKQNTGSVVVFFCGGGGRPACPDNGPEHSGEVTGTWTAADIIAVPAQNVSAGDFTGFKRILRAGLGYANVHTALFPAGEIRGQVSTDDDDHDRDDRH